MRQILAVILLVSFIGLPFAYGQGVSLSNLPAGSSVNSTDLFYDVQTPGTGGVKVTAAQIKAFIGAAGSVGSGTANQLPFYQSAGTNLIGTSTLPLGFNLTGGAATNNQAPNGLSTPVWNRLGTAIDPTVTHCGDGSTSVQERAVNYEGSPQLLTGVTNVFKMWYHAGLGGTQHVMYAESADGVNWTCSPNNPIISGASEPHSVLVVSGTYHLFAQNGSGIDHYTAASAALAATSWTKTDTNIVTPGSSWENGGAGPLYNPTVLFDGTTWRMLYAAASSSGSCGAFKFAMGVATATAPGGPWTKSGSNPVLTDQCPSSAALYKSVGGTYYMWSQITGGSPTISDMARFHSSNFTSWTRDNPNFFTFARADTDEGVGNSSGQVADPTIIQVGNQVFMYYTATNDQTHFKIKVAVANMPIEQLITSNEGNLANPISAGSANPFQVGQGPNGGETENFQFTGQFGVRGYNAFYGVSNSIVQNTTTAPGYIERWRTGTTNAVDLANYFITTADAAVFAWGVDMTSGGAANAFYFGAADLCWGSTGVGTCSGASARQWGAGGLIINSGGPGNSGTGNMLFSFWRSAESAGNSGGANIGTIWDDSTTHRFLLNYNGGPNLTLPGIVFQGTSALGTSLIGATSCATVVTTAATNAASTDTISWAFNAAPGTGYTSGLHVLAYVTTGNVNFLVCNPTAGSLTPAAATLNWSVIR